MILGFKKQFPDGTPTFFEEKIMAGVGLEGIDINEQKTHSIRSGDRWTAGDSIQMAYGVRTKNYRQFNAGIPQLSTCISVQDIFMTWWGGRLEVTLDDGHYLYYNETELLIKNDGLTREQFLAWFFPKDVIEFSGQIVHWTDYRY